MKNFSKTMLFLILASSTVYSTSFEGKNPATISNDEGKTDRFLRRLLKINNVHPVPKPVKQNPAMVELGRNLFFDKELAGRRNISCATCHSPVLGSADSQSQSRGQGPTGIGPFRRGKKGEFFEFLPRNTLSLWNRGVPGWDIMFWDGRLGGNKKDGFFSPAGDNTPQDVANSLALFSIIPITPDQEMRGFPGQLDVLGNHNEIGDLTNDDFVKIWNALIKRIVKIEGYKKLLANAFPNKKLTEITISDIVNSLGAFQTQAFTALESPFDKYLSGNNHALSQLQKKGAILFYGKAKCSSCHAGALQTDFKFYNIAAPQLGGGRKGFEPLDLGRAETTKDMSDKFKFRTPSLRNVELESPYFHNGAYKSLEDAVKHHLSPSKFLKSYDISQIEPELRDTLVTKVNGELIKTMDLPEKTKLSSQEFEKLMSFISSLTDPNSLSLSKTVPDSVPSGLPLAD